MKNLVKRFMRCNIANNEDGFLIVMAIMLLLVLVVIGIASINTSTIELQISGNEALHTTNFYNADGGAETGYRMIEENVACDAGFTLNTAVDNTVSPSLAGTETRVANNLGNIIVTDRDFSQNDPPDTDSSTNRTNGELTNRVIYLPEDYANNDPPEHTNIDIGGVTRASAGSGLQMVSGYEGHGKGSASGGTHMVFDLVSQRVGVKNSQSMIVAQWRHVIGMEKNCEY